MADEYTEQKIRVYAKKKKVDEGKVQRFAVNPTMRVLGFKAKSEKESRLTA